MNKLFSKILLIEDREADIRLIRELLAESDWECEVLLARELSMGKKILDRERVDLVLLDLGLPGSQGLASLTKALEMVPRKVPLVVLTGLDDKALALEAVQKGAQDYLVKGPQLRGNVLARVLRYAIERKGLEARLHNSLELSQAVLNASPDAIVVENGDQILFANKAFSRLCGYRGPEDIIGREATIILAQGMHESLLEYARTERNGERATELREFEVRRRDGSRLFLNASVASAEIGGNDCVVAILRDHPERKWGEFQRTVAVGGLLRSVRAFAGDRSAG